MDATEYGASCPQTPTGNPGGLFTSWRPEPTPPLSEDCLFLNVWTPGLADGNKRAVMVWLHGGGFASGPSQQGWSRSGNGIPRGPPPPGPRDRFDARQSTRGMNTGSESTKDTLIPFRGPFEGGYQFSNNPRNNNNVDTRVRSRFSQFLLNGFYYGSAL